MEKLHKFSLNRRQLGLLGLSLGPLFLAGIPQIRGIRQTESNFEYWERTWNDFLVRHPEFKRDNVVEGLAKDQLGAFISEGSYPTLSFADYNNIQHHSLPPNIAEYSNVQFINDPSIFFSNVNDEGRALSVNGKQVQTLLWASDSWGMWGGNIYSIPQVLQDLLAVHGYNTLVSNISRSATGISNTTTRVAELSQLGIEPDLIIQTIEPGTDPVADMRIVTDGSVQCNDSPSIGNPTDRAIRYQLTMMKREFESTFKIRDQQRQNTTVPLEFSNPANSGYVLKYLSELGRLNRDHNVQFLGLPHNNIAPEYYKAYRQGFWTQIEQTVGKNHCKTVHDTFPRTDYDPMWHPTEQGAVFIAKEVFKNLTGTEVSDVASNRINVMIANRREALKRELYPNL